jgi:ppGpp synthetase/RelA/SpoT-type nucleotidyltranferase
MPPHEPGIPLSKQIEFMKEYKKVAGHYELYAQTLEKILKKAVSLYAPLSIVQSRAKTVSSFIEKIIRKDKYQNPLLDVTDLCGARIITQFQSQVKILSEFIKANFEIDEANSIDVSSRLKESEFGYLSVHYIVTPKRKEILGVPIPDDIKNLKAEVQIRTLLQHAWADILHDRLYKSIITVPRKWQRESARIAAVLEKADDAFATMSESLDAFAENYSVMMNEEQLDREIRILKALIEAEPEEEKKASHALRLAKALASRCEWSEIVKVLEPFIQQGEYQPEIAIETGRAICQMTDPQKNPAKYQEGQSLLTKVAQPDQALTDEDKYGQHAIEKDKDLERRRRARAFFALGKSWEKYGSKDRQTKDSYYNAYRLVPDNPYYFMVYLEYEVLLHKDVQFVEMLRPGLWETIESCRKHIEMDIELSQAFFTMGKSYLLLGEDDQAVNAYAKVADLALGKPGCVTNYELQAELAALERLQKVNPEYFEMLKIILHQILWLKFENESSRATLESHRLVKKNFDLPICIIAGGAEEMDKQVAKQYLNYLIEALDDFAGTVISGGTTSGIPGEVGLVASHMQNRHEKEFKLIGYLPQNLPADAQVDKNYDKLPRTGGEGFSARELLAYWTDIILSDIKPQDVIVLGINGGRISDLEYRLALGLGAKVGLVQNSGRAASGLLTDKDWKEHPGLLVLPQDESITWAFVHQNRPSTLSDEQIEEVAPRVHEFYLKTKLRTGDTSDESMKPWEKLNKDLKNSNREQIAFIERVLNKVGLGIRISENPQQFDLTQQHFKGCTYIETMAEMEHARFVVERMSEAWVYGSVKDVNKKTSPYLVPWNRIPGPVKEYDFEAVRGAQKLLNSLGFEIYRM